MTKEELIGKLQMVYVGDKNALNELICYYTILKRGIDEIQQENKKYKEVSEKLKKAIDECWYMDSENIEEQIFLKKCELKDILKEVE